MDGGARGRSGAAAFHERSGSHGGVSTASCLRIASSLGAASHRALTRSASGICSAAVSSALAWTPCPGFFAFVAARIRSPLDPKRGCAANRGEAPSAATSRMATRTTRKRSADHTRDELGGAAVNFIAAAEAAVPQFAGSRRSPRWCGLLHPGVGRRKDNVQLNGMASEG
ncbi:hypothetical protein SETIT_1G030800v2 [Setaria italica]|uniref:Uncharacterized protein n=1 Tax=Setaria italica TaxID=4555 RepID=A0A368PGA8_SETIT|nr:hypothetical protein SETIT_1G030800v2 [Setaria italica]